MRCFFNILSTFHRFGLFAPFAPFAPMTVSLPLLKIFVTTQFVFSLNFIIFRIIFLLFILKITKFKFFRIEADKNVACIFVIVIVSKLILKSNETPNRNDIVERKSLIAIQLKQLNPKDYEVLMCLHIFAFIGAVNQVLFLLLSYFFFSFAYNSNYSSKYSYIFSLTFAVFARIGMHLH